MTEKRTSISKLRSFGLILGAGFAVIALIPAVVHGESPRLWSLGVAVVMSTIGVIYPPVLGPIFKVWMGVGERLGWVNTRIILSLLFYGLFVPIGMVLRMVKLDPMRRSFDLNALTYRIPRVKRPASHMQRQF